MVRRLCVVLVLLTTTLSVAHVQDATEEAILLEGDEVGAAAEAGDLKAAMDAAEVKRDAARKALDEATRQQRAAHDANFDAQRRLADAQMAASENDMEISIVAARKKSKERDANMYKAPSKKKPADATLPQDDVELPEPSRARMEAAEAAVKIAKDHLRFMMEDPEVRKHPVLRFAL